MKKRFVLRWILNHCYQNTVDGNLIFYSVSDYLVYFTTFCIVARKYKVKVLALCLMPDHIHMSVAAASNDELSGFVGEVTSRFVSGQNEFSGCSGQLMNHPFGSAPKKGDKAARSNIIYVANNPVERRLVKKAKDYRWGFLAYAESDHPFSEKLIQSKASRPLRRALKTVDAQYAQGRPLTYHSLKGMFASLDKKEAQQLTDYIISKYSVIDFEEAVRFFDTYEDMIVAINSNTGAEYDLNEVFVGKNDIYYTSMINKLIKEYGLADIHQVLSYSLDQKYEAFEMLCKYTQAPFVQVAKLLRMPFRHGKADDIPTDAADG